MTVTGRSEISQPGLTHFLPTPTLSLVFLYPPSKKLRKAPPREEEGRGGAVVSLECQLVEREKKYFAFIWPVVVVFMISLRDV